jgi:hypothetical protein
MSKHLILLGDNVFDNGGYVLPGQASVNSHLKNKVDPMEWWVDLRATDGGVVSDVTKQINTKPIPKHSTFVLSVGGNDALGHIGGLQEQIHERSMAWALLRFREIKENFRKQYVDTLRLILVHEKPLIVCTIYNPKFSEANRQVQAEAALSFFNDVITEEALRRNIPIIDLRDVCSDPKAFKNSTELSEIGGDLITDAIISHLSVDVEVAAVEAKTLSTSPIVEDTQFTNVRATYSEEPETLNRPNQPFASPGASWSIEEERLLYEGYRSQLTIRKLAEQHGRTNGAITSCLRRLGLRNESGGRISPYPEFVSVSTVRTIEEVLGGNRNYNTKNNSSSRERGPSNSKQVSKQPHWEKDECSGCGGQIPPARLEAIPGTRLCIKCASKRPSGSKNRVISEPWGSRKDWERDRSSWKNTNS